jgi:hypothetical protein
MDEKFESQSNNYDERSINRLSVPPFPPVFVVPAEKPGPIRRAANCLTRCGYIFSTPHHSAMNSAVAFVDFRSDSRSTYSLKPCIAAPLAPKHRLGML